MGPVIIDSQLVTKVRWDTDPQNYDLHLHRLGLAHDEFIIVNPIFDEWILDYVDTSVSSDQCVMWVKGDKWIAKKFKKTWTPDNGWEVIECNFKVTKIKEFELVEEFNPTLPQHLFENLSVDIQPEDYRLEHVWYLNSKYFKGDRIWIKKVRACNEPMGTKDMGSVSPMIVESLDVIFISYNEPNAEDNWQKVLSKVPYAQRVDGVTGIFEAHKAAAELAQTDMFWVVDGDAVLLDDWYFDYQPNIFNRDCVHVWSSRNPINGLEYGYGGVKLFPRHLLVSASSWNIDMTTGLGKLKVIDRVSNVTAFNTDPFSTWRSAFRECAKLAAGTIKNQIEDESQDRLQDWISIGSDKPFGKYAIAGAKAGSVFGNTNKSNQQELKKINSREWLREQFNEQI
jgi:hypothetical protein